MVAFDTVRRLALALPEAEEATSYGTPAFKVRGKLFARLREDGDDLVVRIEIGHRDALIASQPDRYHVTPHYEPSRYVLVRLSQANEADLADLLADAWQMAAPARLAASFAPDTAASPASHRSGRETDRRDRSATRSDGEPT